MKSSWLKQWWYLNPLCKWYPIEIITVLTVFLRSFYDFSGSVQLNYRMSQEGTRLSPSIFSVYLWLSLQLIWSVQMALLNILISYQSMRHLRINEIKISTKKPFICLHVRYAFIISGRILDVTNHPPSQEKKRYRICSTLYTIIRWLLHPPLLFRWWIRKKILILYIEKYSNVYSHFLACSVTDLYNHVKHVHYNANLEHLVTAIVSETLGELNWVAVISDSTHQDIFGSHPFKKLGNIPY